MGVPPRAPSSARSGLGGEPQAGAAAVARGGTASARSASASAGGSGTRLSRPSGCGPSGRTTCGRSTSSSTRPPDGRALKLLNIVDEFTREALVMLVARSIDADTVVHVLERLVGERGAPELLRMDNGPEMTAHALRDWCELSKTGTVFIEPGSPWQNPFVESFHSRVRDELLGCRGVLLPGRGARGDRGLARGLQPAAAPQLARDARAGRVRRRVLDDQRAAGDRVTTYAPGSPSGRPARRGHRRSGTRYARASATTAAGTPSAAVRPRAALPSSPSHPPPLTRGGPTNGVRPRARELECMQVLRPGLLGRLEAGEQLGAGRVQVSVAVELEPVDDRERRARARPPARPRPPG